MLDTGVCGNIVPHLNSNCSADALCKVSANGRELLNCFCKDGYLGRGLICLGRCPGNPQILLQRNLILFWILLIDIDECETGQHHCDVNHADCSDTLGSYDCHCKEGFFGDGKICIS